MTEPVAVFDTNVVVSGFLSPHGPPGRIVEWLRQGSVRAVVDRIVAEYRSVLARPELKLPAAEVETVLREILSYAIWAEVAPGSSPVELPDEDDVPFAECAATAGCPLVTGNARHFPAKAVGQAVLSPALFVARVSETRSSPRP